MRCFALPYQHSKNVAKKGLSMKLTNFVPHFSPTFALVSNNTWTSFRAFHFLSKSHSWNSDCMYCGSSICRFAKQGSILVFSKKYYSLLVLSAYQMFLEAIIWSSIQMPWNVSTDFDVLIWCEWKKPDLRICDTALLHWQLLEPNQTPDISLRNRDMLQTLLTTKGCEICHMVHFQYLFPLV